MECRALAKLQSRCGRFPHSIALLLCVFPFSTSAQLTPSVPLLESYDAGVERNRQETGEAQALPKTMTICADRVARRCWTEAGATACETEDGRAEVFALVTVHEAHSDAGSRLEACWVEMKYPTQ